MDSNPIPAFPFTSTDRTRGESPPVPDRDARHSLEVLWDTEARGLGLRLLPSGRKTWVLRFRHRGHQRIVNLGDLPIC
jgi:hypothetical protein